MTTRLAVLTNAASRRNREGRWRRHASSAAPGVTHVVTQRVDELPAALDALLAARPAALAVNGGDGTVQSVLTACLRRGMLDALPPIAILPGGTTNMNAGDLSGTAVWRRAERELLALQARPQASWSLVHRPVLLVETADGRRYAGLFFGLGGLVRGVEFWQQALRRNPGAGDVGVGAAIGRTAWGIVRRQPPFAGAATVRLAFDGATSVEAEVGALMVTALQRLVLGMRPYWRRNGAPLACTWMDGAPRQLLVRLPLVLWGVGERVADGAGYYSSGVVCASIETSEPWLLDGEVLRAPGSLHIRASRPLAFLDLSGGRASRSW